MLHVFSSRQEWALCCVTMVWGITFLLVRLAMQACGPFFFVGLRFGIAGCLLLACSVPVLKDITREEVISGVALGIVVALGFGLQTAGLVTITAAKSAFLTAFYIPLVPLFEVLFLRHRLEKRVIVGMCVSFPGVLMIAWPEDMAFGFGYGEIATIVCALVFAAEILLIGFVAPRCNARRLVLVELFVASFLAFCAMPLVGERVPVLPSWVVGICVLLACVTAGMQSILTWAQKKVDPSRATLIYAAEPVWAGLFGFCAGERIDVLACVGCVLVVVGVVVSRRKRSSPTEREGGTC